MADLEQTKTKLSILDLIPVPEGTTATASLQQSLKLAQAAEKLGYSRVWYAEHHNSIHIASAATSVIIAYIAAHTQNIRVGAGGVMLPNHAPLIIAEQFGTLAELYPGRIDLGLGRAPGTDQLTMRALRRDHTAADTFPEDVLELQGYLAGEPKIPGVHAYPGNNTRVPLYILGSSLFGAQLAAKFGLPYAFASHFAPAAIAQAAKVYREEFQPSESLAEPYFMAAVNAIAAPSTQEAEQQLELARKIRAKMIFSRSAKSTISDEQVEALLESAHGRIIDDMFRFTALGTAEQSSNYLSEFAKHFEANELIVVPQNPEPAKRIETLELVAGQLLAK